MKKAKIAFFNFLSRIGIRDPRVANFERMKQQVRDAAQGSHWALHIEADAHGHTSINVYIATKGRYERGSTVEEALAKLQPQAKPEPVDLII